MTFEQADRLCHRIIDFMREMGGPYPTMDTAYLQWCILSCLAARQFVIRMDQKGIRYFACWLWMDEEGIEGVKPTDPDKRIFPESVRTGPLLYVAEVVSRGERKDSVEMIRRIRNRCEDKTAGVFWHQAHRGNRLCKWRTT